MAAKIASWVLMTTFLVLAAAMAFGDIIWPPKPPMGAFVTQFHCVNGIQTPVGAYGTPAASDDVFCAAALDGPSHGQLVCWKARACGTDGR